MLARYNFFVKPSTKNFKFSEFKSKDGYDVPVKYWGNLMKLMNLLEILRAELGHRPIVINSGYRTVEHNKDVGGVKNSQHLYGKAADIVVKGVSSGLVYTVLQKMRDEHVFKGGLGSYPSFTHVDIRGYNVNF